MGFEKMPGASKPESEREQAREKFSHNLPAEAERQMAVQEKESQRQELLARVREKIFGNVFGREHSQGKAGAMEPSAFGNMPKSYLPEEEQERRFEKASEEKAMRNAPHGGGNISGREHSQGKAGAMEPRAFGNMPKSYLPEEEQKGRFEKASEEKAMRNAPHGGGNISGREHSQGKAGAMEPRAFGNMPKSYLPEEEQKGRFEKASAEKAMRNAPHGGGNMPPGSFLSEEEIQVEAKKTWDARKGLT